MGFSRVNPDAMTPRVGATNADRLLYLRVLRCQAGDEAAFGQLLASFGSRTLAHLRTLVGDEADDVQQEVWLTVYRRIGSLANPNGFRTWLFQTTRHRAIDYLRARKREREIFDDEVGVDISQIAATEDERVDLAGRSVAAVLAQLAPSHREVLQLRYEEDLSYAEIALVSGCAVGTVRSRLHNARRHLQVLLAGDGTRRTDTDEDKERTP
jgi:RNA polymerase sigma-70 factor, ECF subfamily